MANALDRLLEHIYGESLEELQQKTETTKQDVNVRRGERLHARDAAERRVKFVEKQLTIVKRGK